MFDLIEGGKPGSKLKYDHRGIVIKSGWSKSLIPWEDVKVLDLVDAQIVSKSDAAVFGAVGAVLGGPVGAAVGASIGGISRPCTFYVETGSEKLIATGWKLHFDQLLKVYKIKKLTQSST